jgi:hypothetical protein
MTTAEANAAMCALADVINRPIGNPLALARYRYLRGEIDVAEFERLIGEALADAESSA